MPPTGVEKAFDGFQSQARIRTRPKFAVRHSARLTSSATHRGSRFHSRNKSDMINEHRRSDPNQARATGMVSAQRRVCLRSVAFYSFAMISWPDISTYQPNEDGSLSGVFQSGTHLAVVQCAGRRDCHSSPTVCKFARKRGAGCLSRRFAGATADSNSVIKGKLASRCAINLLTGRAVRRSGAGEGSAGVGAGGHPSGGRR